MTMNVALNGFGRIGRCVFRAAVDDPDIDVVAINDLADIDDLAYLLQYDSVHGQHSDVSHDGEALTVNGQDIPVYNEEDPGALPWDRHDVDIAFENTGVFRHEEDARKHLQAGADKVLLSAPPKSGDIPQLVYGVNHTDYNGEQVVSNASCTTNSITPMAKTLHDAFGIKNGLLNTVHAYTGSQALIDGPSSKRRRGRAAAENIIPTTTGAANATTDILPELEGKIDGRATRVPTPNGSATYFSFTPEQDGVTAADVNAALREAANNGLQGVMGYTDDDLVSRDIIGRPESVIVDGASTMEAGGMIEVLGWYDNEYGFSCRMLDVAKHIR